MGTDESNKLLQSIFTISRFIKSDNTFVAEGFHLTILQIQALILLMEKKELQMQEIAQHFKVTKPTATALLDKLAKCQLVERKGDKKDRRVVNVSLTEKGQKILRETKKQREKKLFELLSLLDDKDQKTLSRILQSLSDKLKTGYEKNS